MERILCSDPPTESIGSAPPDLDRLRRTLMTRAQPELDDPRLAPHQRRAAARILADLEIYPGLLLADEVGLGKSFVAAAVAREFCKRGGEASFIVPFALMLQWRQTLDELGVTGRIETHEALLGKNIYPRGGGKRLMVVDEAHRFRNPRRKRYRALALRAIGHKVLLITATPICNTLDDLASLIGLFASDDLLAWRGLASIARAFADRDPGAVASVNTELVVRRGSMELPETLQFARLERHVVRYSREARDEAIADRIDELRFPLTPAEREPHLLRQLLQRRLESSRAALGESLRRQLRFYRRARESLLEGSGLSRRDYGRLYGRDAEDAEFQDVLFKGFWTAPVSISKETLAEVDEEIGRLATMVATVSGQERSDKERRLELLLVVPESEAVVPVHQQDRIALIFTGAVATALRLHALLSPRLRCGVVTSRMSIVGGRRLAGRGEEKRFAAEVIECFQKGEIDYLIATDLAAEGLNLQRAGIVVHYDLAWNAVRMEQREGRANRIGQKRAVVHAFYFLPRETRGSRIERIVSAKNRVRKRFLLTSPPAPSGDSESEQELGFVTAHGPESSSLLLVRERFEQASRFRLHVPRPLESEPGIRVEGKRDDRGDLAGFSNNPPRAVADWVKTASDRIRQLLRLPARVDRDPARERLILAAGPLPGGGLETLLTKPYRIGIEFLIQDMSGEYFDAGRAGYLRELLEVELCERRTLARVTLEAVGGIVSRHTSS